MRQNLPKPDSSRPNTVRILTWNVHAGVGPDGVYDLPRIAALVRRHEPDIVALQEIDSRGRGSDAFAYMAKALGSHAAEARTIVTPDGDYGHVLISRWPMTDIAIHDLSVTRREPRRAIETIVQTPYGPLHLASVHLGLSLRERRQQAAMLSAIAGTARQTTVMLGDFNDWFIYGTVRRALATVLPGRTKLRSFPAVWPIFMLDRIYCRPRHALLECWTDPLGRRVSDHLPVFADIRMEEAEPGPQPLSLAEARAQAEIEDDV
ncbi:endonuclease/exonuclease/phosphatase family protein [Ferrovibrio terrae]|uniref:endonuclease/exonuclease/phosphatase family protein n=1 Tax=Ferrovibrio terrae TaxID=2594003 RepID=UPI001C8F2E2E|nr:endonuclease/exonuclease/phosphatase family protein [Ferrovibrio terrae]